MRADLLAGLLEAKISFGLPVNVTRSPGKIFQRCPSSLARLPFKFFEVRQSSKDEALLVGLPFGDHAADVLSQRFAGLHKPRVIMLAQLLEDRHSSLYCGRCDLLFERIVHCV
jgi:hypothetical protein